jgi:hypothetical protein
VGTLNVGSFFAHHACSIITSGAAAGRLCQGSAQESHWVPFAEDIGADMLYLDQPVGTDSAPVCVYLHDDISRLRHWPSYTAMLADTAQAIETGGLHTESDLRVFLRWCIFKARGS